MAVVTKYGLSRKDPSLSTLAVTVYAEGRRREISSGPIVIANGDSATSRLYLGKVSSSAIILPSSTIYYEAIAGVTSLDIGFEKDGANTVLSGGGSAAATLVAAKDVSSAGNASGISAVATANLGKRVYELLGFTKDTSVEYDIVATLNQASTAANKVLSTFYHVALK